MASLGRGHFSHRRDCKLRPVKLCPFRAFRKFIDKRLALGTVNRLWLHEVHPEGLLSRAVFNVIEKA